MSGSLVVQSSVDWNMKDYLSGGEGARAAKEARAIVTTYNIVSLTTAHTLNSGIEDLQRGWTLLCACVAKVRGRELMWEYQKLPPPPTNCQYVRVHGGLMGSCNFVCYIFYTVTLNSKSLHGTPLF